MRRLDGDRWPDTLLGKDVEQAAQGLIRGPDDVRACFGKQIPLAQAGQRSDQVLIAGVGDLLGVLVQ